MIIIGIILAIIGAVLLIFPINAISNYNKEKERLEAQWEEEYDQWQEDFWNSEAGINDAPDRPEKDFPVGSVYMILGCIVVIFVGLGVTLSGASPYFLKFGAKRTKETLDYVGEDITDIGEKMVDIGAPVIHKAADEIFNPLANKAVDEVIAPSVKKIKRAWSEEDSKDYMHCRHCGKKIKRGSKFCSDCGEEQ